MYENNVYYNPEKFGLTVVTEVEWSEPCWSFDTTVVWKTEEGQFYAASDSGCSCPSPFENYNSLEELEGPLTSSEAIAYLQNHLETEYNKEYASAQVFEGIQAIRAA